MSGGLKPCKMYEVDDMFRPRTAAIFM